MRGDRHGFDVKGSDSTCMNPNTLSGNVWINRDPIMTAARNPFMPGLAPAGVYSEFPCPCRPRIRLPIA